MRRAVALAIAVAWMVALQVVPAAAPAAAYPSDNVVVSGHGWGHGRGMGQFGALGYALQGWSAAQVLQHFYSNTTPGTVGNDVLNVQLTKFDGVDAIVQQEKGHVTTTAGAPAPGNNGLLVHRKAANLFTVLQGAGCGGTNGVWTVLADNVAGPITISPTAPNGDDHTEMLQACQQDATIRWYRDNLVVLDDGTAQHLVNNVHLESYLRGVVPRESPASWGSLGGGAGEEALKAQAVAARSYAMAENRHPEWNPPTKTCDTTSCQVYGGRAVQTGSSYEDLEGVPLYATTDNAVASTAGQVRLLENKVARTEFSSSTGGFTAGGTFPAVVDDGDAVAQNPNHDWTANVPVAAIQNAYPQIGTLQSVNVTARTPADGGRRAQTVHLQGTSAAVDVAATTFQSQFGLKSTWFDIVNSPSGGVQGYWLVARDGGIFAFGGAAFYGSTGGMRLNSPVLGMASAPGGTGYWLVAGDGGVFTFGNTAFYGSTGNMRLNKPVVGMAATPSGHGYWLVASDGGIFAFGDAGFFGSTGNIRLNKPIVGMAATPSGAGYWLVASDGGIFAFGDAAFHGSTGSMRLNAPIIGMGVARAGGGYWLVASDGGIFAFGDAPYLGSLPGSGVREEATAVTATATGGGYLIATAPGHVFSYGDAPNFGDMRTAVKNYTGRVIGIEGSRVAGAGG